MASFAEPSDASSVEICTLIIKECFVYKVPPLRTASGHRAEEWNLATPLLTGCLKLFQSGDTLRLVIYSFKDPKNSNVTDDNIQVFGECPIAVKPGENILNFVDGVIDSSRYYVVRIKDPRSSRTTLIGIGFRERDDAFDLKSALNEYVKFVSRMDLASQLAATSLVDAPLDNQLPGADQEEVDGAGGEYLSCATEKDSTGATPTAYTHIPTLKEGEKIKITLGGVGKHSSSGAHASTGAATAAGAAKGLLRPPPPPGSVVQFQGGKPDAATACLTSLQHQEEPSGPVLQGQSGTGTATGNAGDDEEWGDFA